MTTMNATHTQSNQHLPTHKIEDILPKVTLRGGPKTSHLLIRMQDPKTHTVATINVPASTNDLIRIVLPKHSK